MYSSTEKKYPVEEVAQSRSGSEESWPRVKAPRERGSSEKSFREDLGRIRGETAARRSCQREGSLSLSLGP